MNENGEMTFSERVPEQRQSRRVCQVPTLPLVVHPSPPHFFPLPIFLHFTEFNGFSSSHRPPSPDMYPTIRLRGVKTKRVLVSV